jgi:hypothetical protein
MRLDAQNPFQAVQKTRASCEIEAQIRDLIAGGWRKREIAFRPSGPWRKRSAWGAPRYRRPSGSWISRASSTRVLGRAPS